MSDRELADIGLCRGDIHFAIRETAQGVVPEIDHVTHTARHRGEPEFASRGVNCL